MSGLPPEINNEDKNLQQKGSSLRYRLKVYAAKIQNDAAKSANKFFNRGHKYKLQFIFVPLMFALCLATVIFLDGADERAKDANMNILRVENPPISLVYDVDREGNVTSAWLRTPKTSRRIGQLEGLAYIADSKFYSDVDGDGKDDLLWRISFNNEREASGVHLWIGVLSGLAKIYVCSSPYEYTRWDAVPTKIRTPRSCALYVSPSVPGTEFRGKECYSFIYTIKLTTEGPAFVPIPDVYRQLLPILRAAASTEDEGELHRAYVEMLTEFRELADGKAPSADLMAALRMDSVDLIPLK